MNRSDARAFFSRLFARAPEDAAVVASAFPSGESICLSADNVEGLCAAGEAAEVDRQDAYFSACLVGTDFSAARGRGKKPDFRAGVALWVDVDVRSPAHKAAPETLPPTAEDAAEALVEAVGLDPTIVVSSGHGLHAYWVLREAFPFGPGGGLSAEGLWFAGAVEALQRRVRARFAERGWHLDLLADVPRVLRIPGTSNFKLPGDVRPVELILADGPDHDLAAICDRFEICAVPSGGSAPQALGTAPPPVPVSGTDAEVLASIRERLSNLRTDLNREFFAPILRGESFAARGERDRLMQRAASILSFVEPNAEPRILAEVFRQSFEVWASEPGATTSVEAEMEKISEKIVRAQADGRRKKAAREAVNERIGNVLLATKTPSDGQAEGAAPAKSEKYAEEEVRAAARDLGCSVKDLSRRWVVQHKSAFFVLVDGRYKSPITDKELEVSLPRDLARAPIDLWVSKADGSGMRPLKATEILRAHATVARKLVSSLSAQASAYDEANETFTEAVCPMRDVAPVRDPDVEAWLDAFFGAEREKGLDWLATAGDLERYTCALYLSGPPATGKTLLANGVSRLWSVGGPSELGRILENFNEDLMRCPLIFADEHIPAGFRGQRTSTELRNLIGNNRRTLNRKFLPQAPLVGAIRLILAANNDRLLAFNEDLSQHDLEAVAERFLHVNTAGAQGFFRRFPGGKAPQSWIEGDAIAGHVRWLMENRQVQHDGRFLVAGSTSRMHQMLATSGRAAPVVEWISKYLSANPTVRKPVEVAAPGGQPLIVCGRGQLLVNTQAVADHWDLFVSNDRPMSTNKIGRTLAGLSADEKRIGGRTYHLINHDLILGWMESNQVGDVTAAKALIEG